ncbi:ribonuclease III [bacterium]|nr:ribonuclease III [bacterium]
MLSVARKQQLKSFYKKINVRSKNDELMDEALTHPSYNSERNVKDGKDYERLEFLGDSVLRISVSEYLYKLYPTYNEGQLSKIRSCLVSDHFLFFLSKKIDIAQYINIGKHEEKSGGRAKESIIACAMEAVIGAIYEIYGFEKARTYIFDLYKDINIQEEMYNFNSKEILQEYTQAQNKDLPEYRVLKETGKAHDKTYEVGVFYNNKKLGTGLGKTKREAEKEAALAALKCLNIAEG